MFKIGKIFSCHREDSTTKEDIKNLEDKLFTLEKEINNIKINIDIKLAKLETDIKIINNNILILLRKN